MFLLFSAEQKKKKEESEKTCFVYSFKELAGFERSFLVFQVVTACLNLFSNFCCLTNMQPQ